MNPQEYSLNIRPGAGYAQTVKVSQGDVGRPLRFNLLDGAEALGLQTGTVITIHGTKPSGLGFTEACTWSGSAASVTTTLEMTQENGTFPAELVLTLGNEVIGTANFMMNVERSPHDENTIDGTYDVADSIFARMDTLEEGLDATNAEVEQLAASVPTVDATLTVSGAAADAKKTGDEITQIKSDLQAKFGFKNKTNASLFDADSVYSSSSLARTRRWFINHVFNSGDVINDIGYAVSQDSTSAATVYTEIWEDNSGTLTKVFSDSKNVKAQTAQSGTVVTYHAVSDYTVQQKAYVCFCMEGSRNPIPFTADSAGNDNVLVSTDTDPTTETLLLSSLSTFVTKLIPSITISYTAYVGVNVVTIGDGMDYEEIQDALIAINDDTATNPYTFLLMPKSTPYKPFSMLRNSFTDNYPWSGIRTRNISIIGMDKAHCVIRSDSGNYKLPCGEPLTNGIIKNITFVMTNDDQDPSATQGGYCLHIDCKPLNDMGYKMIIEDCDFENSSGPCVGIGVHANCDLQFRRCHFDTTLSAEYNPHEGYRSLVDYGAVFCHTSTADIAPNQKFTLEDCVGVCAEGDKALRINVTAQYNPSTSSFVYTLLRNVFWNKTLNASGYQISASLTANPMNYGNNNA